MICCLELCMQHHVEEVLSAMLTSFMEDVVFLESPPVNDNSFSSSFANLTAWASFWVYPNNASSYLFITEL